MPGAEARRPPASRVRTVNLFIYRGKTPPGHWLFPGAWLRLHSDTFAPGPGVELVIDPAQPRPRDLGIDLCCRDVRVAEHHLEGAQIRPMFEQMRGEAVAEAMGSQARPNARRAAVPLDQLPEPLPRHGPAAGRPKEGR